jgi:hypothetical protein
MYISHIIPNGPARAPLARTLNWARALGVLVLALAGLAAVNAALPDSAGAFGTINGPAPGGTQSAEHERLTRAALACPTGVPSDNSCFEPRTLDQLAGRTGTLGAIGQPDVPFTTGPEAHCDDADFLSTPGYPQSRVAATAALNACITHLRTQFLESASRAGGIVLPFIDVINPTQVPLTPDCEFSGNGGQRAKCNVLLFFGRALHGVQDFYSHSNWTDVAASGPINRDNPPGLNRSDLPTFFNFRRSIFLPSVPHDLSTGCFHPEELVGDSFFTCVGRVRHLVLNKDRGQINPVTGAAVAPATRRGLVGANFANAVSAAIADTRRQWASLRGEILTTHGPARGNLMICAVTHDDPISDC